MPTSRRCTSSFIPEVGSRRCSTICSPWSLAIGIRGAPRLRTFLVAEHGWSKAEEEALLRDSAAEMETAADAYLATAAQPAVAMFDHLYETLPAALAAQREDLGDA